MKEKTKSGILLSIVVPCFNEAENIPLLLKRFGQAVRRGDVEVVLVDNGSTDQTPQVLEELLPRYPFARSIRVPKNQGYGYGIVQGLGACRGVFIGWTHADLQTDPADVIRALRIIEKYQGNTRLFIKGRRRGRPIGDRFFTGGMGVFETIYLGSRLWDVNAQPNVFARTFFETWEQPPKDFALDLYAFYMARRQGLQVKRFPVVFAKRQHGTSHWNSGLRSRWKFIRRTVSFSRKLKRGGIR